MNYVPVINPMVEFEICKRGTPAEAKLMYEIEDYMRLEFPTPPSTWSKIGNAVLGGLQFIGKNNLFR